MLRGGKGFSKSPNLGIILLGKYYGIVGVGALMAFRVPRNCFLGWSHKISVAALGQVAESVL